MVIIGLGIVLGLVLGSLVGCLAQRALSIESFWGRSYCGKCKKTLLWYDLFPVISFFLLGGKCRFCRTKIPSEPWVIEGAFGILIGLLFFVSVPSNFPSLPFAQMVLVLAQLAFRVFLTVVLGILLITDVKKGLLPDRITIPATLIALGYLVATSIFRVFILYVSLAHNQLGKYLLPPYSTYFQRHILIELTPLFLALSSAVLIGIFFIVLIVMTRGKGMGGGDVKLGILIGLALGFPESVFALFISFMLGSLVGIGLIFLKKKRFNQTIPFGPFLAIGTYIIMLLGPTLIEGYLNLNFILF